MRPLMLCFFAACAGTPETATYQALEAANAAPASLSDVAAKLNACGSCGCVQQAYSQGAQLVGNSSSSYPAIYGGYDSYPAYAYVGPYVGSYDTYAGFGFCETYGGYGGYGGCAAIGEYVNALVNADARQGCNLFDKP